MTLLEYALKKVEEAKNKESAEYTNRTNAELELQNAKDGHPSLGLIRRYNNWCGMQPKTK